MCEGGCTTWHQLDIAVPGLISRRLTCHDEKEMTDTAREGLRGRANEFQWRGVSEELPSDVNKCLLSLFLLYTFNLVGLAHLGQ